MCGHSQRCGNGWVGSSWCGCRGPGGWGWAGRHGAQQRSDSTVQLSSPVPTAPLFPVFHRRLTPVLCRPRSAAMRRCSALGNGASTLLLQPLCRLPPRCPGPQPSSSTPTPSAFWRGTALCQGAKREHLTIPGNRVRGDRWGVGRRTSWKFRLLAGTVTMSACSCSLDLHFLLVLQRHGARRLLSSFQFLGLGPFTSLSSCAGSDPFLLGSPTPSLQVTWWLPVPCRVRVHWPEGCGASPCRICAPSPMTLLPPTRIPSTWRTKSLATGHPLVSGRAIWSCLFSGG